MAYYPDLSPYSYSPFAVAGTLNVGWLDRSHEFSAGATCDRFRARLQYLWRQLLVNKTRGPHLCDFCPRDGIIVTGSSELHIASSTGQIYAAPSLIVHYVCTHGYRPPDLFIEAVLTGHVVNPEPTDSRELWAGVLVHRAARLRVSNPNRAKALLEHVLREYKTSRFRKEAEKLLRSFRNQNAEPGAER